ncbi:Hypothetical protein, putative [Bodo saltans]|uniref:Uncharacterized protein n=1 Tax=Bodo saltans TaxID=75058 RepID=A0A0S4JAX0_BODSA|nr:Hypothetical protein, putative [Bodo saltans]|eukprot:CUG87300.1 Hypothetical protein, putative [Bodo saltans]
MESRNETDRKRGRSPEYDERAARQRKRNSRVGRRRDHSTDRSGDEQSNDDLEPVMSFPVTTPTETSTSSSSRHYHSNMIPYDRRQGGPSSSSSMSLVDILTQPQEHDTLWSDVSESRPFRLTQNCGFDYVPQWHREALLGLRHTMPPWRCCKKPEDNYEHFLYPLWQDPAFCTTLSASGVAQPVVPPLEDILGEVMAEKAPDLFKEAQAERAALLQNESVHVAVDNSASLLP